MVLKVASKVVEEWGHPRVFIDGQDVTFLDGMATVPAQIVRVSPFTYKDGGLIFPSFDALHDTPGAGAWSFLRKQSQVVVVRVQDDTVVEYLHVGHVLGWTVGPEGLTVGVEGLAYWGDHSVVPPRLDLVPLESLEAYVKRVFDAVPNRPWKPLKSNPTGLEYAARGDYTSPVNLVSQALATGFTVDGAGDADYWTIEFDTAGDPYQPVLLKQSAVPSTTWTYHYAAIADGCDLTIDNDQAITRVWGWGITPDGQAWRNSVYPAVTQDTAPAYPLDPTQAWYPGNRWPGFSPFVTKMRSLGYTMYSTDSYYDPRDEPEVLAVQRRMGSAVTGNVGPTTWTNVFKPGRGASIGTPEVLPLAELDTARQYNRNANGAITGANPAYDPHLRQQDRAIDFGDGVPKRVGATAAAAILTREKDPAIQGTLTLAVDPENGSLLEIRENDWIEIRSYMGSTLRVRVSQVTLDLVALTATCEVSTRPGPTTTIVDEIHRDQDVRDPARRGVQSTTTGTGIVWDAESPAGFIPAHAGFQGYGITSYIPVSQRGTIAKTEITTTGAPTEFVVIVSNQERTPMDWQNILGGSPWDLDPQSDPWTGKTQALQDAGMVIAWGSSSQPCGYGYEAKGQGAPLTGTFLEDSSWSFEAPTGHLYMTIWPKASCRVSGRFYPGPIS